MPIAVTCRCGRSYNFKDELAGKSVKCPDCGETIRVEAEAPRPQADPALDRDKFLLRQKHLAISAKYHVWDEAGQPILYIERPAHLAQNLAAVFAGLLAGGAVGALFGVAATAMPSEPLKVAVALVAFCGGLAAMLAVIILLCAKRHVTFYRNDAKAERLLEVIQDNKFQLIIANYTVRDAAGQVLARLRKNYLYNIVRKRWYCYAPDGSVLCVAKEDSIILSLLRRFLGPLFGFLRTNFILLAGNSDTVIGEFNRKFTILDRYVLDMSNDRNRTLDRRIALAVGVMLDAGEHR